MESNVKQRLIEFINKQGCNIHSFEVELGFSNGYIRNMRKSMQPDKIEKIALKYPQLNIAWLLTGEGEMLKDTSIGGDSIIQTGEGHNAVINKNKYSGKFAGIPEGSQMQYLMEQNKQLLQQNQKFQEHIDRLLGIIEKMSKQTT